MTAAPPSELPRLRPRAAGSWLKQAALAALNAERLLTSSLRVLPDFLVIGGQRCGTTSFYNEITRHPSVSRAFRKEVHFFDNEWHRGLGWYRSNFPLRASLAIRRFASRAPRVTGEASPYYVFHPHVAGRVGRSTPGVKTIVLLRNPADRAYSHYHHEVRLGAERLSFEEALAAEEERLAGEEERMRADERYRSFNHQHYSYVARGRYAEQLERWAAHVARERTLVLRSEDYYADPPGVVDRAVAFLGLPPWRPKVRRRHSEGGYDRMDPGFRRELSARFEADNRRLYAFLGRDLGWED